MIHKKIKAERRRAWTVKRVIRVFVVFLVLSACFLLCRSVTRYLNEKKILKEMIVRLQADSRVAEVLVTDVDIEPKTGRELTTIKFLEYATNGKPETPKYFTFPGNIIQFQSLVVRFHDKLVCDADALKGKSVYLFWKVFMLDGAHTKEFNITKVNEIPSGYKVEGVKSKFELELWRKFWQIALDAKQASSLGIKCAQIEAPGTKFIPGILYTIKIEHDGGIRIDARALSSILAGERIPGIAKNGGKDGDKKITQDR
ncbi:MAG: hypothetical protein ABIC68_06325 [Candidatus Omnitrophota bacterium]